MSKASAPPDTPQIQVDVQTPFYKGTQKVDVQTNRVDPKQQFSWKWLNWLYPPANPADFALDAGSYVVVSGLIASIGQSFLWVLNIPAALLLLLTVSVCLLMLAWFVSRTVENGWILLGYRLLLVIIGVVLGGVL